MEHETWIRPWRQDAADESAPTSHDPKIDDTIAALIEQAHDARSTMGWAAATGSALICGPWLLPSVLGEPVPALPPARDVLLFWAPCLLLGGFLAKVTTTRRKARTALRSYRPELVLRIHSQRGYGIGQCGCWEFPTYRMSHEELLDAKTMIATARAQSSGWEASTGTSRPEAGRGSTEDEG